MTIIIYKLPLVKIPVMKIMIISYQEKQVRPFITIQEEK
jgi:hypothetical protein